VRELLNKRRLPHFGQSEQRDSLFHLLAHRSQDGAAPPALHDGRFLCG
jgi:hypothetical protein